MMATVEPAPSYPVFCQTWSTPCKTAESALFIVKILSNSTITTPGSEIVSRIEPAGTLPASASMCFNVH